MAAGSPAALRFQAGALPFPAKRARRAEWPTVAWGLHQEDPQRPVASFLSVRNEP